MNPFDVRTTPKRRKKCATRLTSPGANGWKFRENTQGEGQTTFVELLDCNLRDRSDTLEQWYELIVWQFTIHRTYLKIVSQSTTYLKNIRKDTHETSSMVIDRRKPHQPPAVTDEGTSTYFAHYVYIVYYTPWMTTLCLLGLQQLDLTERIKKRNASS